MRGARPAGLATAALVALAGQARADIGCRFETKCAENGVCTPSEVTLTLETALAPGTLFAEDGFPEGDRAVTDAGTHAIGWAAAGRSLAAYWSSRNGFHMLSFDAAGSARYSAHLPEAVSAVYLGTCGTR